jgi:GAF domain-containing protein
MLGLDTDTSQFKHVEEVLLHVAQGTANATGEEFFRQMVQHFALALKVRVVFVTRCMDTPPTRLRSVACWDAGKFIDEEYDLEATPCKKVIEQGESYFIPQDLPMLYPDELPSGLRSFLGIPIFDRQRKVLGHLVFKDDKKMPSSILMDSVYQIFVARAGVELERMEDRAALLQVAQGEGGAPAEERLRKIAGLLSESQ